MPELESVASEVRARERLLRTIAATLAVAAEDLTDESSPDAIASWDSLNHLNIVMAIEEEFGISLSADHVIEMRNIGMIREILRQYGVDTSC